MKQCNPWSVVSLFTELDNILRHLERMGFMTKEFDAVKAAVDRLKGDIATELRQLADALAEAAKADKPADIQAVADDINGLADSLESDDPAPVPAPTPEPTPNPDVA